MTKLKRLIPVLRRPAAGVLLFATCALVLKWSNAGLEHDGLICAFSGVIGVIGVLLLADDHSAMTRRALGPMVTGVAVLVLSLSAWSAGIGIRAVVEGFDLRNRVPEPAPAPAPAVPELPEPASFIGDDRSAPYAMRILEQIESDGQSALSARNLVQNSSMDPQPDASSDWSRFAASDEVRMESERRSDENDDWMAVVEGTGEGYLGGWCQTVTVQPGREYAYFFQAEANLAAASKVSLAYWDYQRLGKIHSDAALVLRESIAWTNVCGIVRVPAFARRIAVCPALLTNPGAVRFDNVWFIPLDAFDMSLEVDK